MKLNKQTDQAQSIYFYSQGEYEHLPLDFSKWTDS